MFLWRTCPRELRAWNCLTKRIRPDHPKADSRKNVIVRINRHWRQRFQIREDDETRALYGGDEVDFVEVGRFPNAKKCAVRMPVASSTVAQESQQSTAA